MTAPSRSKSPRTFVIAGASLAGAKAAETLRDEGFGGRIVLVGEERERPYERPALSKDYLRGESDRSALFVHDTDYYAEQDIELRTGTRVSEIRTDANVALLDDGEAIPYDRLLLATGSVPVHLDAPGADLEGVHHLRTLADADALAAALAGGGNVVVIGGGFIGAEVAASARQLGRDVTLVLRGNTPLERALGREVGAVYRDLHSAHGVDVRARARVESLLGSTRVEAVRLADGSSIPADVVVAGIGAAPRIELAADAGLVLEGGIAVDARLRTSAPDVYAAGDVAAAFHPLFDTRLRVEHWANARNQGATAARNMLDRADRYERIPYFFSDQFELGMEYSGHAARWDRVVFRGDPAQGEFVAFWVLGGRVVAGMSANVWDVTDAIQQLIRDRVVVDVERLADPATPLEAVAAKALRATG